MRLRELALFVSLAPFAAGCGKSDAPKTPAPPAEAAHDHKAPHGGVILELGDEEAHLEMIHDAKTGSLTIYVYGKNLETPVAVAMPVIQVVGKSGAEEVKATAVAPTADGTSAQWAVVDPRFMSEPLVGRISVKIAGKTLPSSPLEPADVDHTGHNHK